MKSAALDKRKEARSLNKSFMSLAFPWNASKSSFDSTTPFCKVQMLSEYMCSENCTYNAAWGSQKIWINKEMKQQHKADTNVVDVICCIILLFHEGME